MKSKTNKNNAIEFLRFVFCIGILVFHIGKYLFGEPELGKGIHFALFPHGSLGVEFFFVLSGLLMAASIKKEINKESKSSNLVTDEYHFMKRKIKSVFPYHTIAFILAFIVLVIVNGYNKFETVKLFIDSIPSFFFLQMSGVGIVSLNHVEWYISVMLLVMAVLYPICKKNYNVFTNIVCPIGSLFILGYLQKNFHSLTGIGVNVGIFYKGFLRGLAEIMLGMFLYNISENLSSKKYSNSKKLLFTIIELSCYIMCFLILLLTITKKYEIYMLFALSIAIPLTFSKVTYTANIFRFKIFELLGQLTLPLYLTQLSAIWLSNKYFLDYSDSVRLWYTIILSFILSIGIILINEIYKELTSSK